MYFTQLISQLPIFYKNRKHKRSVKLKTVDKAKTTSRHTPIQIMKLCLGAAHNSSNFSYLDTKLIFSGRKQSYHPNKYGHPLFIHQQQKKKKKREVEGLVGCIMCMFNTLPLV